MFWPIRKANSPPATDETEVETSPTDLEQGAWRPNKERLSPIIECLHEDDGNKDKGGKRPLEPSKKFTGHQIFYIVVLHGIGSMVISAGISFAIAYFMYTTKPTPIRLFRFPNTLAGDAAVSIIAQCVLTWFVEMFLVRTDLGKRAVQPIGFIPEPSNRFLRWLFFLSSGKTKTQISARRAAVMYQLQQALRGLLLSVVAFVFLWPVGVGALTLFGERDGADYEYANRWVPQFFKLVFGGVLGLLTTPLMALFWLLKAGWEAEAQDQEKEQG